MLTRLLLILAIALLGLTQEPALAKERLPKPLRKIEQRFDLADPVQAAIFTVLKSYPKDFASMRTDEPLPAEQQERIVDWYLAVGARNVDRNLQQSQMDRLREAEIHAASARRVNVEIPGAFGYYWDSRLSQPGVKSRMQGVKWVIPAAADERIDLARGLHTTLSEIVEGDGKWRDYSLEDVEAAPVAVQLGHMYLLSMLGTRWLEVLIHYGRTDEVHDAMGGVHLWVDYVDTFD